VKMVVTLAVLAVAAVFGLRVLVATYAWKGCGMPGDAAFIRAVIGLGAQPGVLECAGGRTGTAVSAVTDQSTSDHQSTADYRRPCRRRSAEAG
jgi:hypothetical protein